MRPVLLYDCECRLCRWLARLVVRLDREGAVALLPFSDEAAAPLLEAIQGPERLTTWHLVLPDGRRVSGGRAAVPLLRTLRWTRPAAPLLRVVPLDAVYGAVSRRRSRLGRFVPEGEAPRRYP